MIKSSFVGSQFLTLLSFLVAIFFINNINAAEGGPCKD